MFLRWIVSLVIYAVAILAVDQLFETFYIDGFLTALIASFVISILNIFVRPILVLLTLPITFVTFGFFLLVINAATLMLAQDRKSTRLNSSHVAISYAVFCLK